MPITVNAPNLPEEVTAPYGSVGFHIDFVVNQFKREIYARTKNLTTATYMAAALRKWRAIDLPVPSLGPAKKKAVDEQLDANEGEIRHLLDKAINALSGPVPPLAYAYLMGVATDQLNDWAWRLLAYLGIVGVE